MRLKKPSSFASRLRWIFFFFLFLPSFMLADESLIHLKQAHIDLNDKASLQRGAKIYINYCLGCHSMAYLRYNRMAEEIGIVKADGSLDDALLKKNLIFTGAK